MKDPPTVTWTCKPDDNLIKQKKDSLHSLQQNAAEDNKLSKEEKGTGGH